MFRLDVELSIWFIPPMEERRRGITLLQSFNLPFVPAEGLPLTGKAFNPQCPSPEGFPLKDVTWDVDRQLFLARLYYACHDLPIAFILDELSMWLEQGWRFGNLEADYEQPEDDDTEPSESNGQASNTVPLSNTIDIAEEPEDGWPTQNPRSRPKAFNKLLRALVREMAALHNNSRVAYAIDCTNTFFTTEQLRTQRSPRAAAFSLAMEKYDQMSLDEQSQWQEQVLRSHPRLDRLLPRA